MMVGHENLHYRRWKFPIRLIIYTTQITLLLLYLYKNDLIYLNRMICKESTKCNLLSLIILLFSCRWTNFFSRFSRKLLPRGCNLKRAALSCCNAHTNIYNNICVCCWWYTHTHREGFFVWSFMRLYVSSFHTQEHWISNRRPTIIIFTISNIDCADVRRLSTFWQILK